MATQERVPVVADASAKRSAEEKLHPEMAGQIARVVGAFVLIGLGSIEFL